MLNENEEDPVAPSEEVDAAVGAAPERDPIRLLEAKRRDLAKAEQKLEAAQAALDVDAEVQWAPRIAVMRDQLTRLEAAAAGELDRRGEQAARTWLADHARRLGGVGEQITKLQQRALRLVEELVAVIGEETALRSQVTNDQVAQEFVTLRWPTLASVNGKPPTLPRLADYETPIVRATQDLLPRRGLRIMDSVPTQANDTPETLRKKVLKTLAEFLRHPNNVKALGPAVEAIITKVGIPAWETPEEQARREERAKRKGATTISGTMSGASN